ncbi:MAG TPA: flagellar biosynthesis protein FlhB [Blastocatellia bacterium]|nr:flagellar biosynthesis protein FlhB [Blastocatellia bacterium]
MSDNRTEKATPRRREDARRKGQIARGPELPAVAGFLATVVLMRALGSDWLARAAAVFQQTATLTSAITKGETLTPLTVHRLMMQAVADIVLLALPVVMAALTAGIAGNVAQGGWVFTPSALALRGDRFNPVENFKRVFNGNSTVELIKQILKLGCIGAVCYSVVAPAIAQAPALVGAPAGETLRALGSIVWQTGWRAGAAMVAVAALDYGWKLWQHEKSLRMTKQEIRREYREQEGDPAIKAQRRRAARAMLQRYIAAEVPKADVVVTNPTHYAVALRYDRAKYPAPVVVAKGADEMARRIREIAKAHDVMIVENPPLARGLYRSVEVGKMISPEFFKAVAELLAWVYRQRSRDI